MSRSPNAGARSTVAASNGDEQPVKPRSKPAPLASPKKPLEVMPPEQAEAPAPAEQAPEPAKPSPTPPEPKPAPKAPKPDASAAWMRVADLAMTGAPQAEMAKAVIDAIHGIVELSGLKDKYNFLFVHESEQLNRFHSDQIYQAVGQFKHQRPILLTIQSIGGSIEAAYLISKLCREHSHGEFAVAVPRYAKSAATLLCCGADKIHMGSISDLGPIDPQMNGVPALALKNSIEHLISLVETHPSASEMIATYLSKTLPVSQIGHFERTTESAVQYAERLLQSRNQKVEPAKAAEIARKLVYHYKDHGFVIDRKEATEIFGTDMVITNTPEYGLANLVHQFLTLARYFITEHWKGKLTIAGSEDYGILVYKQPDQK